MELSIANACRKWMDAWGEVRRCAVLACFPPKCHVCDRLYPPREGIRHPGADIRLSHAALFQSVMDGVLCPECRERFTPVAGSICAECGLMLPDRVAARGLCRSCRGFGNHFAKARTFGVYDQSLRAAIHQLKYQGRIGLAGPLGALLFRVFTDHWHGLVPDMMVPVPLHPRKMRRRGFNQVHLLLRGWPGIRERLGLSLTLPRVCRDALKRDRETPTQTGMDRHARRRNVGGAFSLSRPQAVAGAHVLLVDDVFTTGATANECAQVLLQGGARRVDVLTLAQTPRYV